MIKFVNKNDGAVFYAEDGSVLYAVLINDKNYEIAIEEPFGEEKAPEEPTQEVGTSIEEEKPKRGTKKEGA